MWESGFNKSSIYNEGDDFYNRQQIEALTPVKKWVENTTKSPSFILEQEFEEAFTLREACDRLLAKVGDKRLTSVGLFNELRRAHLEEEV